MSPLAKFGIRYLALLDRNQPLWLDEALVSICEKYLNNCQERCYLDCGGLNQKLINQFSDL